MGRLLIAVLLTVFALADAKVRFGLVGEGLETLEYLKKPDMRQ